jgi:pSer/pThr/pTyr-binding forkhead associated (FHA) protein
MKVSLVVASGVHQGKVIPITGPQFLIGRDPQCQLRPASQAVSKQHCAVLIRDGKVFVKDFGSTNGTLLNDTPVQNEERAVANNDSLKIGPLDFTIRVELPTPGSDSTPLPSRNPEAAAALAAVKATAGSGPKAPLRDATPSPSAKPGGSKVQPGLSTGSKEAAALKTGSKVQPAPAAVTPSPEPAPPPVTGDDDHDKIAALLLGMAEDGNAEVPEGSTVMDMPSALAGTAPGEPAKPEEKKEPKKEVLSREDMSNAASEILRKMMRRPR